MSGFDAEPRQRALTDTDLCIRSASALGCVAREPHHLPRCLQRCNYAWVYRRRIARATIQSLGKRQTRVRRGRDPRAGVGRSRQEAPAAPRRLEQVRAARCLPGFRHPPRNVRVPDHQHAGAISYSGRTQLPPAGYRVRRVRIGDNGSLVPAERNRPFLPVADDRRRPCELCRDPTGGEPRYEIPPRPPRTGCAPLRDSAARCFCSARTCMASRSLLRPGLAVSAPLDMF